MKILAIGYYDDFARFFLAIKREFRCTEKKIEFRYFSLYLSGFLYFFIRCHHVVFLPLAIRYLVLCHKTKYQKIVKTGFYKGIDLNKMISYHLCLHMNDKKQLLLQAVGYIKYYDHYLNKYNPDILLLSGDSRMAIQILNELAKKREIKTYYFEQGPFGTTILDEKGVNANASIRNISFFCNTIYEEKDEKKDIILFLRRQRRSSYKRNPIYRASDYIYQLVFIRLGLLPVDIKMEKIINKNNSSYSVIKTDNDENREKNILLVLQVPYDVNMIFHSPLFNNHADIVKYVYKCLPKGYKLFVREHPLYKSRYENELYQFMIEKNIGLDCLELAKSMKSADVVVVNNSTVGIEAIAINKSVVILGDCYYDNAGIALKLIKRDDLPSLLTQATTYEIDENKMKRFFNYFLFDFLVEGHFRDENLVAVKSIVKNIR